MWDTSVEHIHYLNERSDISMIPLEDYLRRFDPTKIENESLQSVLTMPDVR